MAAFYIGLNSGTSMDGIDAGLFDISSRRCKLKGSLHLDYPAELRAELIRHSRQPDSCTLDVLGHLDNWVGECFMTAASRLMAQKGTDPGNVRAIGSHGQTLRHQPRAKRAFSLQIGDPNIIATGTGVATVADFRRSDIALGGEGAPLACAFHRRFLSSRDEHRVVVNIGGIANVTALPPDGAVTGFDTGPGNTLLDAWIRRTHDLPYDDGGNWAAGGTLIDALFHALLEDPYFSQPPPKSTGFEYFHLDWLSQRLRDSGTEDASAADIQATLAAFSARTIAEAVRSHAPDTARVLACGGGVRNTQLMDLLGQELAPVPLTSTASEGIDPDWVECATFAWLAACRMHREPASLPSVTGAAREAVLGAVWHP